ncbi:hypothetical protein BKA70DRAFT_1304355 [Coprinopsis sp. MPI-PUGE-AT-0042]|nr:hypothetical protein BKA70DRAFT_1304355 [Coprinopsis sp. MPI-PUGE-AT-0042]
MSSQEATRGAGKRGGRGRGNRGRGRGGRPPTAQTNEPDKKPEVTATQPEVPATADLAPSESGDQDVCWICAETVKYYSVSQCNHRTCHICALRLRALYKRTDCTFCKEPQIKVIFTTSADALYETYTPESTPFNDSKLSIFFETREMMEETLILLRFNCPDPDCDYLGNGWADLKLHIRASHGKLLCDLCIRFKKVFAHEHALYPPSMLPLHLPSMHQRSNKKDTPPEQIEGGIHPLCEFCRECFFSTDELYPHMRERHEECFICKRNEIRDQYFQNYDALEKHFNSIHYACQNKECQAQKFVVFNTPLDLQAHMVEQHGSDMTSRDRKMAQRVQAEFGYEQPHNHRRQEPARQQQQQQQPPPSAPPTSGPSRGGGNSRRAAFGGNLTVDQPSTQRGSPGASRPASPPPDRNVDPATLECNHSRPNPTSAVPAVKAASRGYVSSESSAKDFILTVWNVLNHNLDQTASIVNMFVDLLEEEDKKSDLLGSWRTFAVEQRRQFPDLVPNAVGTGYAGITSGRVLNAKNSAAARTSQQGARNLWDRVARAAGSSSANFGSPNVPGSMAPPQQKTSEAFPRLGGTSTSSGAAASSSSNGAAASSQGGYRPPQRTTPWSATASAAASGSRAPAPVGVGYSVNMSKKVTGGKGPAPPPPKLSKSAFPDLPAASVQREKPQVKGNVSLKNILGTPPPAAPAWGAGSDEPGTTAAAPGGDDAEPAESGGGKKKKGKQKQTLFTLGSFPT